MPHRHYRGNRGSKFQRGSTRQGPAPRDAHNHQSTNDKPNFDGVGSRSQQKTWRQNRFNYRNRGQHHQQRQNQHGDRKMADHGTRSNEDEILKHFRQNIGPLLMTRIRNLKTFAQGIQSQLGQVLSTIDEIHPDDSVMDWQLSPGTVVYVPCPHLPVGTAGETLHPELRGPRYEYYPCQPSSFPEKPYNQDFSSSVQRNEEQNQSQAETANQPAPPETQAHQEPSAEEDHTQTQWTSWRIDRETSM